jgi:arylformamidase
MNRPLYRNFYTQQELDAEYDVERSVPDFMAYAKSYVDESKLARHRLKCVLDVRYGPTIDEHVDIFPASRRDAPVLIFIHGGAWRILSSKEFSMVAMGPVAAGITVVNVNYSLCPKVTMDEIVRQARSAVAWTYRRIASYGGDPQRIFISGHSAGAHLSAMALATDWPGDYGLPADIIKGALCLSGLYDLTPLRYTLFQPALQLSLEQAERNSPLLLAPPRLDASVIVSWGSEEPKEFQRHSADYLDRWQRAGNRGRHLVLQQENHFTVPLGLADASNPLCAALFQLMRVEPPNRRFARS